MVGGAFSADFAACADTDRELQTGPNNDAAEIVPS